MRMIQSTLSVTNRAKAVLLASFSNCGVVSNLQFRLHSVQKPTGVDQVSNSFLAHAQYLYSRSTISSFSKSNLLLFQDPTKLVSLISCAQAKESSLLESTTHTSYVDFWVTLPIGVRALKAFTENFFSRLSASRKIAGLHQLGLSSSTCIAFNGLVLWLEESATKDTFDGNTFKNRQESWTITGLIWLKISANQSSKTVITLYCCAVVGKNETPVRWELLLETLTWYWKKSSPLYSFCKITGSIHSELLWQLRSETFNNFALLLEESQYVYKKPFQGLFFSSESCKGQLGRFCASFDQHLFCVVVGRKQGHHIKSRFYRLQRSWKIALADSVRALLYLRVVELSHRSCRHWRNSRSLKQENEILQKLCESDF